jgi:hypothetical protein
MNDKLKVGRRVASRLFSAEKAIDEALAAAASLQISLIEARQETGQACGTIQASLNDAVAASAALMEARRAIVGAHGKLERLRDDLGLPATATGCTFTKYLQEPPAGPEETAQLKAV